MFRWRDARGASAVEFALLLPFLMLILVGIIDFGLLMFTQEVLTNATREGARKGIVQVTPKPSVADIQGVVLIYANGAGVPLTAGEITVSNAGMGYPGQLTVTVSHKHQFIALPGIMSLQGAGGQFGPSITVSASTIMAHE